MFNEQIDVAQIMRDIKKKVYDSQAGIESLQYVNLDANDKARLISQKNEYERIGSFIYNTCMNLRKDINIGSRIPAYERFPKPIALLFRFLARISRKSIHYIIRDQVQVNSDFEACINAVIEREDVLNQKINILSTAIQNAIDQALMQKVDKENLEFIKGADYLRFEKVFRGESEEIAERQKFYLDKYISSIPKGARILDVGCGRGEWIRMLNENEYYAVGVDNNLEMVNSCKQNGLLVAYADIITFLSNKAANSMDVITGFQIVEHISKNTLFKMLKECFRVLSNNGMIIFETPNICNIEVGASSFYLDPTHISPIHPELMKFMAKEVGFSEIEICYYEQEKINNWLVSITDNEEIMKYPVVQAMFNTLKSKLYCPADYAIVARKVVSNENID